MKENLYELFLLAEKKNGLKQVLEELNVVSGTVARWKKKEEVPKDYYFDLMRLCNLPVDYSSFTPKEKNQYFTDLKTAEECFLIVKEALCDLVDLNDYMWTEPSAGSGAFLKFLPKDKTIAMDIEPLGENIIKQDFFNWKNPYDKSIVIGNPPFGLRGQQALKFLNKALESSDFVCFILPPLFDSDGRGTPKNRVNGNLIGTWSCSSKYYYPDGTPTTVQTIFQIWTRLDFGEKIEKAEKPINYKIYSLSDGGTPGTTRNKDKIGKCNFYLPSTCFGEDKMKILYDFNDLPQKRGYGIIVEDDIILEKAKKIKWNEISFKSTNGALNLRMSLIIKALNK